MTQRELATTLFVSESAVSKWEKNVARPDITLLPKLSLLLGVSEHELITASVDTAAREEKAQARKWRILSLSWSLFFYISYIVALIPCFICNLAIDGTLSWFWIVVSALILSFSFTNLPKLIKRHRLILLPVSQYLALILLLAVCCIYVGGDWFWISAVAVLVGLVIIFTPIYIAKYSVFAKVRRYNDFVSLAVDFIVVGMLLFVINGYTHANGFSSSLWSVGIGLPILTAVYFGVNLLLCIRFLPTNRLAKTGVVLILSDMMMYLPPLFIRVADPDLQKEIDQANIFNADLSVWGLENVEANVHLIICLTLILLSAVFLTVGFIRHPKGKGNP